MNFFRCAQTVPEALARAVAAMPHSRRLFSALKRINLDCLDPISRAARFVWSVHRSFGGCPNNEFVTSRVGSGGGLKSTASIAAAIIACAARFDRVILECLDWRICLKKYDAPATFFYLDPPYLGCEAGHHDLARVLKGIKAKWLLTIGDTSLMRELYRGYPVRRISTAQSLKKGLRGRFRQLLIRSF